jgi:hypothetical protein
LLYSVIFFYIGCVIVLSNIALIMNILLTWFAYPLMAVYNIIYNYYFFLEAHFAPCMSITLMTTLGCLCKIVPMVYYSIVHQMGYQQTSTIREVETRIAICTNFRIGHIHHLSNCSSELPKVHRFRMCLLFLIHSRLGLTVQKWRSLWWESTWLI